MGTLQAPTDETKNESENKPDKVEDGHRFEGKVTEEQELSASVARKRRTISKKRTESGHRPRDLTPARELLSENTSLDDDAPKTPERKLKKTVSNNSNDDNEEKTTRKQPKCNAETNTGLIVDQKEEKPQSTIVGSDKKINETLDDIKKFETGHETQTKEKTDKKEEATQIKHQGGESSEIKDLTGKNDKIKDQTREIKQIKLQTGENKQIKLQTGENKQIKDQVGESSEIKAQIDDNNKIKRQLDEITKVEAKTGENSKIKDQIGDQDKIKGQIVENIEIKHQLGEMIKIESQIGENAQIRGQTSENVQIKDQVGENAGVDANTCQKLAQVGDQSKNEVEEPKNGGEVSGDLKSLLDKAKQGVEPVAPVRERPARMKRDKQIKKRSQSTPRPAVDDLGSKEDLEVNILKLKQEKEMLESKLKTYRHTDKTTITKQEKDMLETILKTDQQIDQARRSRLKLDLSESKPRSLEENQKLIDDFKHAQILSAFGQDSPQLNELTSESSSGSTDEKSLRRRKPLQPAAQQFLERRKLEKTQSKDEEPSTPKPRMTLKQLRSHWKSFKADHPVECDKIRNIRNKCMNEIGLIMILCGLGGLLFKFTEGAFENYYKCGVKRVKRDFIEILWRGSHNLREDDWKSLARTKLKDFEEQLHEAHEAGVHTYSGQRAWSFLNGIVYCLTIITTIGYGHMYPTTTTGRALTIVYALIGIPLFLIVLTDFGKLFTRCIKFVWAFVRRVYYTGTCKNARKTTAVKEVMKGAQMVYEIATFRRPSQYNIEAHDPNEPPKFPTTSISASATPHTDIEAPETPAPSNFEIDDEFNLPITVALTILILYIFSGAIFYNFWEEWDFLESFYFVFISMSTIGFGDYVPKNPICMIASMVYLVFGLALMSMCINVVQLKLSDTFRQASAKLGATIGLKVAEEDGSITTIPPPTVEIADVHTNNVNV